MFDWRRFIVIFLIGFVGMCCVISVDRECQLTTGEGGKTGLSIGRSATSGVEVCFFGLEGELNF